MLVLQHSYELSEGDPAEDTRSETPGEMVKFVSKHVQRVVYQHFAKAPNEFATLLRGIPQITPYLFEDLVLNAMTSTNGVSLKPKDGLPFTMKFAQVGILRRDTQPETSTLYRPDISNFPSIDALGVSAGVRWLIQTTVGREHTSIQERHIHGLGDAGASKTICLYITPAGEVVPKLNVGKGKCNFEEQIASAGGVLENFPADVRAIFGAT